jgi:hypothetical protein
MHFTNMRVEKLITAKLGNYGGCYDSGICFKPENYSILG